MQIARFNDSASTNYGTQSSGLRLLTMDEMECVAGGGFGMDVAACAAALAVAAEAPSIGSIGSAAVACANAANNAPPPDGSTANCVGNNACVDASVDGSDGNGSVGGGDSSGDGGGCGGAGGGCSD